MTPAEPSRRLDTLARGIAEALAAQCDRDRGFRETEFYGTAFACMLWRRWPERFPEDLEAGLARLRDQDKRARIGAWQNPYHWEFIRFALADLFRSGSTAGFANSRDVLGRPGFVGNRVANWMLLRSTVRVMEGQPAGAWLGRLERRIALSHYQQPGGFIEDQRGAPTQQYHAFMTALLGYQIAVLGEPSRFLRDRFAAALQALQRTALHDGEVNAVGRGQFQSFGYAAACLALAFGLKLGLAAPGAETLLGAVLDRLEAAACPDGTLPLMIDGTDARTAVEPAPAHPHQDRIGWHSYNNDADYLAFSGAVLKLAAEQLEGFTPSPRPEPLPGEDSLKDGIRVFRNPAYSAIVTLPHAGLTAAQPLPYIVTASGARPLPAYGGEKLPGSIYGALAHPLPVIEEPSGRFRSILNGAFFRWASPDRIVGETGALRFERKFRFAADIVEIEDALILNQPEEGDVLHLPWLPLAVDIAAPEDGKDFALDGARLVTEEPLAPVPEAGPQYGMSGKLRVWSHAVPPPPKGDIARAVYRIRLTP
ncbi:MAG: hypothetical protein JJ959_08670 [Nisaea sp.]|uniref:hypothetical protein n=1 Tax=Nisaea sp. TaxID=2024842 RepID=UPI001B0F7FD3|nr:hypothetical protein [Nisaea sp.]MBO6560597.1 hypothetical protein [Nisaea sp.]